MAERFEKLFSLQENLYSQDAPLIVSAGALLKDTETERIIVQLKYHSLSQNTIVALKIGIRAFDVEGKEIEGVNEYQYLDLNVSIGQDFGSNKAIVMPNAITRSFSISSIVVITSDGVAKQISLPLAPLPRSKTLYSILQNNELVKQYQIETSKYAAFAPHEYRALWCCSCGEWNIHTHCTKCHISKEHSYKLLDRQYLEAQASKRLISEKIARDKSEKEAVAKKRKKIAIIGAVLIVLIIVFGCIIYSSQHKYDDIAGIYVLANETEAKEALYKVNKDSIDEFGFNPNSYQFEIKGSGKIYGLWFVNKRGTLTPRAANVEKVLEDGTCIIALKDYPDATVTITINAKTGKAVYYSEYGYHSLTLSYKLSGSNPKDNNQESTEDKVVFVRGLNGYVPHDWKVYNQASQNLGRASIGTGDEYRSWYISYKGQYDTFSDFVESKTDEVYVAEDSTHYRSWKVANCKEGYIYTDNVDGVLVVDFYVVCDGHVFNLEYNSRLTSDDESKTEAEDLLKNVDFKNFKFE